MFPVSHLGLFYLFGKSVKIKKLWVGMIATVIPDIALLTVGILAFTGINITFSSSHPINLFLHSIFPILLFLPLAFFYRWYFYSSAIGYSFHLLLDYMTHSTIRMPFYPISSWKLPIYLLSYMDAYVTLIINISIALLLVIFFGKKIMIILGKIFYNYKTERVWLLHLIYVSFVFLFGVLYLILVLVIKSPISIFIVPFVIINIYYLGILFILEIYRDENLRLFFVKDFVKILKLSDEIV